MSLRHALSSTSTAVVPDSAWSWLVVAGNMVIGIMTLGFYRCMPVFFNPIMLEFDVEYGDAALILGLLTLGMAFGWDAGSTTAVIPDSAWSWLVVAGNMVIGIMTLGFFRCMPVFFNPIMLEFDVEYGDAALILGLSTFGIAFGCFFLSSLTFHFGSKLTCLVAGLVLATSNIISSQSSTFVVILIFSGFLSGTCVGILFFTSLFSCTQYFVKHRAKATGISTLGVPLGTLILPPVIDVLITHYSWRGALLICSGFLLNSCVSAALYRPVVLQPLESQQNGYLLTEQPQNENLDVVREVELPAATTRAETKKKCHVNVNLELFKNYSYDIGVLSAVFYCLGYVGVNTFLIPFAEEGIHVDSLKASSILSFVGGAECVAKIVTGYLGDLKRVNSCILLAVTAIVCSLIVVMMTLCKTYAALAVMALAYGFFVTAYMGIIPVVMCDIVGRKNIAKAIGYQGCIYNVFLFPWLYWMGRLVDENDDVKRPFYPCSVFIALASVCLLAIYWLEKRKKRLNNSLQHESKANET